LHDEKNTCLDEKVGEEDAVCEKARCCHKTGSRNAPLTMTFFLRFFFKKVKSSRKRFSDGHTT
jgi:hypothetical protein